ncbi:MAG: nitroreductase family protein [Actinobacteria bacterium]|nr:nitroreductase family protein [Actinomycetota bacterium]MBU1942780.1 nitroreductase family protein [Actinomycetota bacterium]MBU2686102.1 nitroreductase family protein [Actinomycetota bacterium]
MPDMESNRRPTRDYRAFSSGPWPLWDVIYARRSSRKYVPMEVGADLAGEIERTAAAACELRGVPADFLMVVTDQAAVDRVRTGAQKGAVGKINMWLTRAPLVAFLVMTVPDEDINADRPSVMPRMTMAVEDCILWLTERDLGTCWMAGINQGEVKKALGIGHGTSVPVVISIGRSQMPGPLGTAGVLARVQSRRRKTLDRIAVVEEVGTSYEVGTIPLERFEAVDEGVAGLMDLLARGGRGECGASPELQVEACLEAARFAPSGGNAQAWQFVVVRDPARLERLAGLCGRATDTPAGFALLAAGYPKTFSTGLLDKPFWMLDIPIALSHLSLTAVSMGCRVSVQTDGFDEGGVNGMAGLGKSRTVGIVWVG